MGTIVIPPYLKGTHRNSAMKFFFLYYTQCNKTRTQCVHHVPGATSQRSLHPPTSVNHGPSKSPVSCKRTMLATRQGEAWAKTVFGGVFQAVCRMHRASLLAVQRERHSHTGAWILLGGEQERAVTAELLS